jgi:hypothetical protein
MLGVFPARRGRREEVEGIGRREEVGGRREKEEGR